MRKNYAVYYIISKKQSEYLLLNYNNDYNPNYKYILIKYIINNKSFVR